MISFAQNYEDVILDRIFRSKRDGFYVDIGAGDPVYESVTHHFHLREWTGVNVEPQPDLYEKLRRSRPRDTNLNTCVGSEAGKKTLYVTSDRGTSTLVGSLGRRYRLEGRLSGEIPVDVMSLNTLWRQHVGERQVDFLKIDVEGFEPEVLEGTDFEMVRPLVVVVEAIHPTSRLPTHERWEPVLLRYYRYFYFDGLNRFYHRIDHPIDTERCATPPNVLDRFKTHRELLAEDACRHLSEENQSFRQQLQAFEQWLAQKDAALEDAAQAYKELARKELESKRHLSEENQSFRQQLQAFEQWLAQKDAALEDAAQAYKELESRFKKQLVELQTAVGKSETGSAHPSGSH